jgi:disulfide bond formation protein DsbB
MKYEQKRTPAEADNHTPWLLLAAAWIVSLAATLGALFVGEVMGQAPCELCWYQRIFMFPLAVMLGIAVYVSDLRVARYALPLAAPGGLIALYHSMLYFGVIPQPIVPCGMGPSCSSAHMLILGGIPLPLLSLGAFAATATLLLLSMRKFQP